MTEYFENQDVAKYPGVRTTLPRKLNLDLPLAQLPADLDHSYAEHPFRDWFSLKSKEDLESFAKLAANRRAWRVFTARLDGKWV